MARFYALNDLLEHLLREDAGELHILTEKPPLIVQRDKQVEVGAAGITDDNIAELLYCMATVEQMKELNTCGDVRFIYLFRNWVRFAVAASVAHNKFSIKIKNLGR
jgi:Tfp pilus assembly ATPase PilU